MTTSSASFDTDPVLEVADIQGHVIGGLSKDLQAPAFPQFTDPARGRVWLAEIIPQVATREEALGLYRLFKAVITRRHEDVLRPGEFVLGYPAPAKPHPALQGG